MGTGSGVTLGKGEIERFRPGGLFLDPCCNGLMACDTIWVRAGGLRVQRAHGGQRRRHGALKPHVLPSPPLCVPPPSLCASPPPLCVLSPPLCVCFPPPSVCASPPPLRVLSPPLCVCFPPPSVDYACNGLMAGDATVMAPAPAPSPDSPSPPPPPSTTPSPPPPSGGTPPTKGVLCPASTFDGYEYQLELGSGNYLLHWKFASNTVINFLLEARSNTIIKDAWMAVGFSKKGKMKGSDAVIGNLPGVGAFYMSGYRLKNIQQTSLSLGTTSVSTTSEGGTSIAFSRTVGTGNVPLKLNTTSYLIWAFA
ncbi:unnamed protein product [Closterium sp. Naga37s-1]|nr:unnamed protein product [Closterium sp. Naga37s-1]